VEDMSKRIKWTDEMLADEAKKYETRSDFVKGSNAARTAQRRGIMDKICAHMPIRRDMPQKYTDDDLINIASKYSTLADFYKQDNGAYQTLKRRPIWNEATKHLEKTRNNDPYSEEEILEIALRYDSRADFKRGCKGAYAKVFVLGLEDKAFEHMIRQHGDYDAIYVWEAIGEYWNDKKVYKIGLTSARLKDERMKRVAGRSGLVASMIILKKLTNTNVSKLEKQLHEYGEEVKFSRDFDGCTEFRALAALELDLVLKAIDDLS